AQTRPLEVMGGFPCPPLPGSIGLVAAPRGSSSALALARLPAWPQPLVGEPILGPAQVGAEQPRVGLGGVVQRALVGAVGIALVDQCMVSTTSGWAPATLSPGCVSKPRFDVYSTTRTSG